MSKVSRRVVPAVVGGSVAVVVACCVGFQMVGNGFRESFIDDRIEPPASIDGRYCSAADDLIVISGHRFTADRLTRSIARLIDINDPDPPTTGQGTVEWDRGEGYAAAEFSFEEPGLAPSAGEPLEAVMTETGFGWQLDFGFSSKPLRPCGT
ncbi:hypothetical protein [Actinoplanes sp. HUAS TT8]|uniref:hypothetical protein n=1 Tax=Actinoplanes sp. HUAS TT8 TaxID=3447453 RepID=UPI003F51D6BF